MYDELNGSNGVDSGDLLTATYAADGERAHPGARRRRRTDWRVGGRAVSRWNLRVLVVALLGTGVGVVGGTLASRLDTPYAPILSLTTLWLGLLVGVLYAFLRSRPAALLTFKPQDFLWGAGLGLALRLIQGVSSDANSSPFPSGGSGLNPHAQMLLAGVLGPVVEEAFFRGVVLVVIYQLLRRSIGVPSAATSAALFSTGAFVLIHAAFQPLTVVDGLGLFVISMSCSGVVLLTGRLWGAVLAHMIYNATFLALVLLGGTLA